MNFFVILCEINWNGGLKISCGRGAGEGGVKVSKNHEKNEHLPPLFWTWEYYSRDSNKMIHLDHFSLFVISIDDNVHVYFYNFEL